MARPRRSTEALSTVAPFKLGDSRLEQGDLLRLRLVRIAVVARPRLLLAQGRVAVSACREEERGKKSGPHCTRLMRSSLSGGPRNPVMRPGPSCATEHSGCGLLHPLIPTLGTPRPAPSFRPCAITA